MAPHEKSSGNQRRPDDPAPEPRRRAPLLAAIVVFLLVSILACIAMIFLAPEPIRKVFRDARLDASPASFGGGAGAKPPAAALRYAEGFGGIMPEHAPLRRVMDELRRQAK
jgi:hypothetical protein